MKKSNQKYNSLIPLYIISAAADGDVAALSAIVKHYERYIRSLCTCTARDEFGNSYSYVDEEMCDRLKIRLIKRTLAFDVHK